MKLKQSVPEQDYDEVLIRYDLNPEDYEPEIRKLLALRILAAQKVFNSKFDALLWGSIDAFLEDIT